MEAIVPWVFYFCAAGQLMVKEHWIISQARLFNQQRFSVGIFINGSEGVDCFS